LKFKQQDGERRVLRADGAKLQTANHSMTELRNFLGEKVINL